MCGLFGKVNTGSLYEVGSEGGSSDRLMSKWYLRGYWATNRGGHNGDWRLENDST